MKKIFLIIGIVSILSNVSQASEWKIISDELTGYNFYTNKMIKGRNF